MSINSKYTGFEKLLHDKVNNFEFPYDNKDWLDFEKKLPKSPRSFTSPKNLFRYLLATSAVVVSSIAIMHFANKHENINTVLKTQTIINNNKPNNSQSTNTNSNDNTIQRNNKKVYSKSKIENSTKDQSKEQIDNNKFVSEQKNNTENNYQNNPVNKENNAVPNQSGNKNIQNPIELIYANIAEGCAPLNVQFESSISSDTITYLWSFGDHKISTKQTPSHTYNKSGTYTVTLTMKFEKSQQTKKITYSKNITVLNKPEAMFDYTVSEDGYDYAFNDGSTEAVNWYWNFGDKSSSKEKSPQHSYKINGSYNIQLVTFNAFGCSDTTTKVITVKLKEPFYINNAFIPGGVTKLFGPIGENMNPEGYKMGIYDNIERLVFETSDIGTKWNGKISGTNTDAKAGAYSWKISMKDKYGTMHEWTGYVTLIR